MPLFRRAKAPIDPSRLREWFGSTLEYYRGLGFFEGVEMTGAAGSENELYGFWEECLTHPQQPLGATEEVFLISLDEGRVWLDAIEVDQFPGNHVFEELIAAWARISRGAFRPSNIREEWDPSGRSVSVHFDVGNIHHVIRPDVDMYFFLDAVRLVGALNRIVEPSGFLFCTAPFDGDSLVLVVLNIAEIEAIKRDRKIQFEPILLPASDDSSSRET